MARSLMTKLAGSAPAVGCAVLVAGQAPAQSTADFIGAFSGEWYVFDPAFRSGGSECRINLGANAAGIAGTGTLPASSTGCAAPLASVAGWRIEDGQILLIDEDTALISSLGGNQRRITGTTTARDLGLIIERAEGDGSNVAISSAISRHRCYFLGFSQTCADAEALAAPQPSGSDGSFGSVEVLASLNVRTQPRRDSPIIGTLAEGTVVNLNYCTMATDGIWCRASFGTETGWLAKSALRQNEWPIVTYRVTASAP